MHTLEKLYYIEQSLVFSKFLFLFARFFCFINSFLVLINFMEITLICVFKSSELKNHQLPISSISKVIMFSMRIIGMRLRSY